MFQVTKRMEVAGSHSLSLPYKSKCSNTHGHNWIIEVTVSALNLNSSGMVIDFTHIKKVVNKLDHTHINTILPGNPTAEKIAKWVADKITQRIERDCLVVKAKPWKKHKGVIGAIADYLYRHPRTGRKPIHAHLAKLFPEKVRPYPDGMWVTIRRQLAEDEQANSNGALRRMGLRVRSHGMGLRTRYQVIRETPKKAIPYPLPKVVKVSVQESEGNLACYIP